MDKFAFIPTLEQINKSNIHQFMKRHNIQTLAELSTKAKNDLQWFWKEVEQDVGVIWDKSYDSILDTSEGIEWPKWFQNGKINIVKEE